jgi:hypothetical protein
LGRGSPAPRFELVVSRFGAGPRQTLAAEASADPAAILRAVGAWLASELDGTPAPPLGEADVERLRPVAEAIRRALAGDARASGEVVPAENQDALLQELAPADRAALQADLEHLDASRLLAFAPRD